MTMTIEPSKFLGNAEPEFKCLSEQRDLVTLIKQI